MIARRSLLALAGASLLPFGGAAAAQTAPLVARAASPDGTISVQLATDNDGRPIYSVTRLGAPVVTASRLGFILTDAPKLERGFVVGQPVIRSSDET